MVFNIPKDQQQVRDRMATDVQNELPESNPFFRNSFIGALITSLSGAVNDLYLQLNVLIKQMFVDTATNGFLERWGVYKDITRNPATKGVGIVVTTGVNGSIIPANTLLQSAEGVQYEVLVDATIANVSILISSLSRSGDVVTAVTGNPHGFATGLNLTISGAGEADYNISTDIVVVDEVTFTYSISTTPSSPASGTILATVSMASLSVQSLDFGANTNAASGAELSYSATIVGVDDTALVEFGEIAGGTDEEGNIDLRERIVDVYQKPISQFNKNQIITTAKSVSGVTRVFVFESDDKFGNPLSVSSINRSGQVATVVTSVAHGLEDAMTVEITGSNEPDYNVSARVLVIDSTTFCYVVSGTPSTPATGAILSQSSVSLGQVLVFFTRDNDASIIPSGSEVITTKDELLKIKPVNTSNNDLIVSAPTPVSVDFTFTNISPDTSTMRTAIQSNLAQLFQEDTSVGVDLRQFNYESVIFQTVDPSTGDVMQDFTLSAPSGDVAVLANEIPTLGTISFT